MNDSTDTPDPSAPAGTTPGRLWTGLRDAGLFLFTARGATTSAAAAAGAALLCWGLLTGLAWAAVFRAAWRVYGEIAGLRVLPALAVLMLEAVISGRHGLISAAHCGDRLDAAMRAERRNGGGGLPAGAALGASGVLLLLLLVLGQWALLTSIPFSTPRWPSPDDWRSWFNRLFPAPIYRPLLLAPLWGRWAIIMAAGVGHAARGADGYTRALCHAARPSRVLASAIVPLLLTGLYFSRKQNYALGVIMGMGVFAVAYVTAVVFARRLGGQTRQSLLATSQVAQFAFLAIYRAMWGVIYL